MEGTESGWGRPAEPAPRWRALLDRARLGGRTGEQPEVADPNGAAPRSRENGRGTAQVPNGIAQVPGHHPEPGHSTGGSWMGDSGHPAGPGHPSTLGHPGYPADPADHGYPADQGPPAPAAGRYAALAPPPAPAAPGGYPPGYPVMPGHPADRAARPVRPSVPPPSEQGFPGGPEVGGYPPAAEPPRRGGPGPGPGYPPGPDGGGGYPARIEWRESRPDAEVDRATGILRRNLGIPRVLAFANPKGGVHKTTATVLAAATIGSVRGRGVLAWDDNELRGTLGLRAGSARHARTIRHLISDLVEIEGSHGYELTDRLDDYLRHASDGSYDVLAGEESPRFAQRLDPHTVRRVLELLRRTHDVICVDTGNNVESANWQTVLQAADQLVVTCVPREDAAFTADWMLDLLDDVGMGDLVRNAVTLLSCPSPGPMPLLDDLRRHFATRTRAVAVVPYDPALETGSSIEYVQLQPETRQAWLQAAAMMLEPFVR